MSEIARYLVRHKVGVTAVVALGIVFMAPNKQEQLQQPTDPWSARQAKAEMAEAESGDVLDKIVDGASSYFDEGEAGSRGDIGGPANPFAEQDATS